MNNKLISVIVPVYNAEPYLQQCVDSVIYSGFKDLELILVNDGSADNSLHICYEYARNNDCIKVIDKVHSGVSDTRNAGIINALGDYIVFIDADDYLSFDALKTIGAKIQSDVPDLLIWGFRSEGIRVVANDTKVLNDNLIGFQRDDLLYRLISIEPNHRVCGFVGRFAIKRSLLVDNNILFNSHLRMSEDYKFLIDAVSVSSCISVIADELYIYRINNGSVTARYRENIHVDLDWINSWLENSICRDHTYLMDSLAGHCAETYVLIVQNLCNPGTGYNYIDRVRNALRLKKQYNYENRIISLLKSKINIPLKRRIVFLCLMFYLEPIYIWLYSKKRGTL